MAYRLFAVVSLFLLLCLPGASNGARQTDEAAAPPVRREFRGVWVATVGNIDWPSKPGLPVDVQKAELTAIMDRAARIGLNAVILQVRPACDALYDSRLEPWSEYLTGQQGKAPNPYYDPLTFAVDEAHKRGLELHAWINPYRARHSEAKSPVSPDHISRMNPEICKPYGNSMWLDPGEQGTQDHSLAVILDIVKRYDIDGIHVDDYFYPYVEKDAHKQDIPFPDEASWSRYRDSGGDLSRDDWRRANVDAFIQRMYKAVKAAKPWVKVGISPFGIWRPGYPVQIKGYDAYQKLYADSRKWLRNGWCDYFTPQLYWKIEQTPQSYPVLLNWWIEQNAKGRHIWPGNYTSRVGDGSKTAWTVNELLYQIKTTRGCAGSTGNVHFSMKCLMANTQGLSDALSEGMYAEPALVPASPWLGNKPPARPTAGIETAHSDTDPSAVERRIAWAASGAEPVWRWIVQTRAGTVWSSRLYPGGQTSDTLVPADSLLRVDRVIVTAVDRLGNESAPCVVDVPAS